MKGKKCHIASNALSRCNWSDTHSCAVTSAMPHTARNELRRAQQTDSHLARVIQACTQFLASSHRSKIAEAALAAVQAILMVSVASGGWHASTVQAFCTRPNIRTSHRPYHPGQSAKQALLQNHDAPSAGHQGPDRTLERLHQEAHWVNMASDVEKHCRKCTTCQQAKPQAPQRVPIVSRSVLNPILEEENNVSNPDPY